MSLYSITVSKLPPVDQVVIFQIVSLGVSFCFQSFQPNLHVDKWLDVAPMPRILDVSGHCIRFQKVEIYFHKVLLTCFH